MLQGGVYKLVDKDGNVDKKRVLKAKHRYALLAKVPTWPHYPQGSGYSAVPSHLALPLVLQTVQVGCVCKQCNTSLTSTVNGQVKREWEIGRCIHNIYEPDKALPGYMGTGEGVVTENGNFVGALSALL